MSSCKFNYEGKLYTKEKLQEKLLDSPGAFSIFMEKAEKNYLYRDKDFVNNIFEKSPYIEKIGDKVSYNRYIDSIFPDSIYKDVLFKSPDGIISENYTKDSIPIKINSIKSEFRSLEDQKDGEIDNIPLYAPGANVIEFEGENGNTYHVIDPNDIHEFGTSNDIISFTTFPKNIPEMSSELNRENVEIKYNNCV